MNDTIPAPPAGALDSDPIEPGIRELLHNLATLVDVVDAGELCDLLPASWPQEVHELAADILLRAEDDYLTDVLTSARGPLVLS